MEAITVKEISSKIFNNLFVKRKTILAIELDKEKKFLLDFFSFNFVEYTQSYIDHYLMFATIDYWESFVLQDWRTIIVKSAVHDLSLVSCIAFLYRDLGIDSLELLEDNQEVDENLKKEVFEFFKQMKGVLGKIEKYYLIDLQKFGISQERIQKITDNLIKQGAKPAKKITLDIIKIEDFVS